MKNMLIARHVAGNPVLLILDRFNTPRFYGSSPNVALKRLFPEAAETEDGTEAKPKEAATEEEYFYVVPGGFDPEGIDKIEALQLLTFKSMDQLEVYCCSKGLSPMQRSQRRSVA